VCVRVSVRVSVCVSPHTHTHIHMTVNGVTTESHSRELLAAGPVRMDRFLQRGMSAQHCRVDWHHGFARKSEKVRLLLTGKNNDQLRSGLTAHGNKRRNRWWCWQKWHEKPETILLKLLVKIAQKSSLKYENKNHLYSIRGEERRREGSHTSCLCVQYMNRHVCEESAPSMHTLVCTQLKQLTRWGRNIQLLSRQAWLYKAEKAQQFNVCATAGL